MTATYPGAERQGCKLFALAYTKALFRSDAIRIAGRDAVLLVAFIAAKEDELRYKAPPRFWRAEIMERFGFRSPKDFNRIKNRAIEEGLLEHVEGNRLTPASYWVLVPEWLQFEPFPKGNDKPATRSQTGTETAATRSQNGTESGTDMGTESGTLSSPTPIPDPKKNARPCRTRKPKTIQADDPGFLAFWDVYPKQVAKPAAAKAFPAAVARTVEARTLSHEAAESWLVERAKDFADQSAATDQQFIPHPATWLNQERFNDQPAKAGSIYQPFQRDSSNGRAGR